MVVNLKHGSRYDVYIGRGSIWGNPWSHKTGTTAQYIVATRQLAIEKYEEWLMTQPNLLVQIPKLKSLVLGCWCKPFPCHGDVLVRLANAEHIPGVIS